MIAMRPIAFRQGHDGLAALAQTMLHEAPFTGRVLSFAPNGRIGCSWCSGTDLAW